VDLQPTGRTSENCIEKFKTGFQRKNNLVKDVNGNLIADSHSILNLWKNFFSQLLNVSSISDVREMEVHIAELLVPDPSRLEVSKLKKYKSSGNDQIQAELIKLFIDFKKAYDSVKKEVL
jgi:hypothetical protein